MLATESGESLWSATLGQLQLELPRPNYETWLKDTRAVHYEDDCLVVAAPSAFVARMLEDRLSSTITRAVERVVGRSTDVVFEVAGAPANGHDRHREASIVPSANGDQSAATTPSRPLAGSSLNPAFTFETFVVGPSNRLAHAAASQVAEAPGTVYNPLYLYSEVGLGKTHLLHAIGHELARRGMNVMYVSSERFTNEYIKAIREGHAEKFRERYRNADVLLIDDIQFIASKEQTQEGFFHTFNELHMSGRQVVVTGDEPARRSLLEERIQSRLEGGLVVDIQSPDYETRYAILQSKAASLGSALEPAVLDTLARRAHANVRELEGCLNRIIAYSQLTGAPITAEMAAQAVRNLMAEGSEKAASPASVLRAVAEHFGIDEETLCGKRRDKKTSHARRVAMYLLREESQLPSTRIGQVLGGKDHSTVLYAHKRMEEQLDRDPALRHGLVVLRQAIYAARGA